MKELLFILTDSAGVPVTLRNSPDGWDESMVVTERSRTYHGIFRSFTIPLKFIKQGATIIRNEFYRHGMRGQCSILVQKLNRITLTYFDAYTGKIDFATFKDHDNDIEVMAVDGSLARIIKSRESDEVIITAHATGGTDQIRVYSLPYPPDEHTTAGWRLLEGLTDIMDVITDGGITDGTFAVKSDFLSSGEILDKYFLISESATKWVDQPHIYYTTNVSLSDYFRSLDAIWCLGMGVEMIEGVETLRIEQREHFFNTDTIINVGNSKGLTVGMVSEFNISKIKVGYPEKSYSDSAFIGNDPANNFEPNTETTYAVQNLTTKQEYDIVCKFRGDSIGFDNLWNTETSDTGDTDLFIVRLRKVNHGGFNHYDHTYGALRKKGASVDCYNPWNLEISPKRNLLRHKRFINGCCYGLSGTTIDLMSATNDQKNNRTALISWPPPFVPDYQWETEYEGFTIDDTDTWFRPLEINIDAAYPSDLVNIIAANPYGVIEFIYKKTTFTGYILKMETKLSGAGSVKYSLLCTSMNDLTKLIR